MGILDSIFGDLGIADTVDSLLGSKDRSHGDDGGSGEKGVILRGKADGGGKLAAGRKAGDGGALSVPPADEAAGSTAIVRNSDPVHLVFVIDKSSSMKEVWDDVKAGYLDVLNEHRKAGEQGYVTTVLFSDADSIELVEDATDLYEVGPIELPAGGNTAFYDAVGMAIDMVAEEESKRDGWSGFFSRTSVLIVTDGGDNESREWNMPMVRELIGAVRADGMLVSVLGTGGIDAYSLGRDLGIPFDFVANFTQTHDGVRTAFDAVADLTVDRNSKTAGLLPAAVADSLDLVKPDWKNDIR